MTTAVRRSLPAVLLVLGSAGIVLAVGTWAIRLPLGAPLVVLGLGGATLALAALALYRTLDPLLRPATGRDQPQEPPARRRALEREKQAALKAIREIELDHQMRKLGESDYQGMIQRYRARIMRLFRELDAGDDFRVLIAEELKTRLAAIEAAGGGRACKSCGAGNDADAVFCKQCGQKL